MQMCKVAYICEHTIKRIRGPHLHSHNGDTHMYMYMCIHNTVWTVKSRSNSHSTHTNTHIRVYITQYGPPSQGQTHIHMIRDKHTHTCICTCVYTTQYGLLIKGPTHIHTYTHIYTFIHNTVWSAKSRSNSHKPGLPMYVPNMCKYRRDWN
jgi:hypothetical protein